MKNIINLGKINGKMLIFGGPYSNLEATKELFKIQKEQKFNSKNVICTGDICAYCSNPLETSNLIKDSNINVVKGNCEESLGIDDSNCNCGFGDKAQTCSNLSNVWYNYSLKELNPELKKWMRELPDLIRFEYGNKKFLVCHGSPEIINKFMFESVSLDKKRKFLEKYNCDIIIAGHTGIPFIQNLGEGKYWINSGVIGIPANDGTNNGWYFILDDSNKEIILNFNILEFDYKKTVSKMNERGLSKEYSNNLETGLWLNADILPEGGIERKNIGKKIVFERNIVIIKHNNKKRVNWF